jgi:hypothetical protein
MEKIHWVKAILNGLLVWFLGLLLVVLPGLILGTMRSFELVDAGGDPAVVQDQVAEEVMRFYQDNRWVTIGLQLLAGVIVFWRARAVARGTGSFTMHNALIVGAVPTLINLVLGTVTGPSVSTLLNVVIYMGAAALAAYLLRRKMAPPARRAISD